MTYIQLINSVLRRLREDQISTATAWSGNLADSSAVTDYQQLIGDFVNDAITDIENAWDWSGLRETIDVTTVASTFSYVLTDAGHSVKELDVVNDTDDHFLEYRSSRQFNEWFLMQELETGSPKYYSWNGMSSDGDMQVELWPVPDGVYSIHFNVVKRGNSLALSTDTVNLPDLPIILLAYAKAVSERGEDNGTTGSTAYAVAEHTISDFIAIDAAKHPEETIYHVV